MAKKEFKKQKGKEVPEVELDLEGIPFVGGLLKGLGKLVDLAERVEKAGGKIEQKGEIRGLGEKEGVRGIYGFSIRTGIGKGGIPRIQTFGNIRKTKKGPKIVEAREPIVDVFDEKDQIVVMAELPGVTEAEIKTTLREDIFIVESSDADRKYYKEVLLPSKVDAKSEERTYKNGVLEIKFKKQA